MQCCAALAPISVFVALLDLHAVIVKEPCENLRMGENEKPRSAVEIAMERLKKRDAESGVVDRPLTDEQKTAIAEAKSVHAAKAAELEILQRSKMAGVFDPADRERLDAEYRDALRRLHDDFDRKVGRIRRAPGD